MFREELKIMKIKEAYQWTGPLHIIAQEGGFAYPYLEIGGKNITTTIAKMLHESYASDGAGDREYKPPGKYRMTIERIE